LHNYFLNIKCYIFCLNNNLLGCSLLLCTC